MGDLQTIIEKSGDIIVRVSCLAIICSKKLGEFAWIQTIMLWTNLYIRRSIIKQKNDFKINSKYPCFNIICKTNLRNVFGKGHDYSFTLNNNTGRMYNRLLIICKTNLRNVFGKGHDYSFTLNNNTWRILIKLGS